MTLARKRRWFRFSLRGLFVGVSVLCLWIGYRVNQVDRRDKIFKRGVIVSQHPCPPKAYMPGTRIVTRVIFGDTRYRYLKLSQSATESDRKDAELAFPEASVQRWSEPYFP